MTDKHTGSNGIPPGLKPWKKGQSGNPKGRPKRADSVTQWVHELSQQVDTGGMTRGQLVAEAVYRAAIGGDMTAAKLILDRVEPAPTWQDLYLRDRLDGLENTFDLLKEHRNRSALEN